MNFKTIVMKNKIILKRIRILILIFIVSLVISGLTAFPIKMEINLANYFISKLNTNCVLYQWINIVTTGVNETYSKYPFIAYGTDWLAFAHIVIAIAFIGPLKYPVKNIWVIEFGIIACIMIIPLALIAGSIRGIPFFWRLIDCSFGVFGFIPLIICHKYIKQLEKL
jgi:hypothetical protein